MVKKWGLSFLINTAKTPEGRSPGSLAWAGLANTYFWIDPARDVAGVILMQVLPFADGKCLEAFAGFERGVYAGLDAARPEGGVDASPDLRSALERSRPRPARPERRLVLAIRGIMARCGHDADAALKRAARVRDTERCRACTENCPGQKLARYPWADVLTHGDASLTEIADSYVCGIADAPLLGDTIGRSLDQAVRRWGDREALVSPSHGVRWTWREFAERVDALAAGFLALGLERGARIGVWSLNRPEWTLTQFAAAKAGLILVTINPAYRLSELEYALNKVGCARDRHGDRVQDQRLHRDAQHAGAGTRDGAAGRAAGARGCRSCAR